MEERLLISEFFEALNSDKNALISLFHKEGTLHINNQMKDLSFFTQLPNFIQFHYKSHQVLFENEIMILIQIYWDMLMPNDKGQHQSLLSFCKDQDHFKILSMIDYGN